MSENLLNNDALRRYIAKDTLFLEIGHTKSNHAHRVWISELGQIVEQLAAKYNRISIHLKGSRQHTKKGLKDSIVYVIAHNV